MDGLLLVMAVAFLFGLFCAKASFFLFSYGLGKLLSEIAHGNFIAFTNDGLVYYGGLMGGIAGAYIAVRKAKYNFSNYVNAIIPCVPLGHAIGRIGCLLAGCCYGVHYEGFLAVHSMYVDPIVTLFPIQAVESLLNTILFFVLLSYTKKKRDGIVTLSIYLILYSVLRFFLEFFRGDLIRGIYWGMSTSQWISIFLLAASTIVIGLNWKGVFSSSENEYNR